MSQSGSLGGRLPENLILFVKTLRSAGLAIGPAQTLDALKAAQTVGLSRRDDFYWALHSVLIKKRDQHDLFDQAFHLFWRNPKLLERMLRMMLPELEGELDPEKQRDKAVSRRLAEALQSTNKNQTKPQEEEVEQNAAFTFSDTEVLQTMDFEMMSVLEIEEAKRIIRNMEIPIAPIKTRRFEDKGIGQTIDFRKTLRHSMQTGGDLAQLKYKSKKVRQPPLVVLCDISGSMAAYSRMLLHFFHQLMIEKERVHAFVFGTRLTHITHQLRHKDVDEALDAVGESVVDWSGGTRIGDCLDDFNKNWARRVLGQGALVLLVTDGLDRQGGQLVGKATQRLARSARKFVWLNPLLRYEGYQPKAKGAAAIVRYADEVRSVHSLDSLSQLVDALSIDSKQQNPFR